MARASSATAQVATHEIRPDFFLYLYVWLVVGICAVFLLAACGSVSGFACLFVCVFLPFRA